MDSIKQIEFLVWVGIVQSVEGLNTALGEGGVGGRDWAKKKKQQKELMEMDNSVVIVGEGGVGGGGKGCKGDKW